MKQHRIVVNVRSPNRTPASYRTILMGLVPMLVAPLGCRRELDPPGIEEAPIGSSAAGRPPGTTPVNPAPSTTAPADGGSDARLAADAATDTATDGAAIAPPVPTPVSMPVPTPAPAPDAAADGPGGAGPNVQLDRGLVLLLRFEDGPGSTAARDESGNGNRVTLVGLDPGKAWAPGKVGGGLDFQLGSGAGNPTGHLAVDGSPSLDRIGSALTIAVWIVRPVGRHGSIVSRRSTTGAAAYQLEIVNGDSPEVLLNERPGFRLALTTETKVMANRWTHLAFTYDGQIARLYIDGQVVSSGAYTAPITPVPGSPLLIAADLRMDPKAPLFPRLDDLRLYDRGLSEEEIGALARGAQ